jgi:hypothetical protein
MSNTSSFLDTFAAQYIQPMKQLQKRDKFRLPRKTKKAFQYTLWLYPTDAEGNSVVAWPASSQEDFEAYKRGELRDIMEGTEGESAE